jgi:hypothetical protein
VEIDGNDPREAGRFNECGDNRSADRLAAGHPPILTGVPKVRHDSRQASRTGTATRIGEEKQLHEVLVGRQAGRLNHIHIVATDALLDVDVQLTVIEAL